MLDRELFVQIGESYNFYEKGVVVFIVPYVHSPVIVIVFILPKPRFTNVYNDPNQTCSDRNSAMATKAFTKIVRPHDLLSACSRRYVESPDVLSWIPLLHLDRLPVKCWCLVSGSGSLNHKLSTLHKYM